MSRFVFKAGHRFTADALRAGLTVLYGKPAREEQRGKQGRPSAEVQWKRPRPDLSTPDYSMRNTITLKIYNSKRSVVLCSPNDDETKMILNCWRTGKAVEPNG